MHAKLGRVLAAFIVTMAAFGLAASPVGAESYTANCLILGVIPGDIPLEITASAPAGPVAPGSQFTLADVTVGYPAPEGTIVTDGSLTLQGQTIALGDATFDGLDMAKFAPVDVVLTAPSEPGVLNIVPEAFAVTEATVFPATCTFANPLPFASVTVAAPSCLGEDATIVGGADQTAVAGTPGDDVILATAPGATISPGTGSDKVCADAGGSTVSYADAPAGVFAALNADVVITPDGNDQLDGIANATGSRKADVLVGNDGPNVLRGGDGVDILIGGAGADTLDGGKGLNILFGDRDDTCTGGIPIGCRSNRGR